MNKEFRYRPQYSLLLLGLAGLAASFFLLPSIGLGEIGFSLLTGLFGLGSLALAIIFLVLFARQLSFGNLKITDNQIEIPEHWTKKTILDFNQIKLIGSTDSWDKLIKVSDGQRTYSIQGQLMDSVDHQELKIILKGKLK